jgi:TRAP-type uncharacterized transport system substrate-binding protein
MRFLPHLVLICALLALTPDSAASQAPSPERGPGQDDTWTLPDRTLVNEGTVTVVTAPAGGASALFGSDLARVLDDGENLRVLPVLGRGPVRNVIDVLYLKSIDMGLVAADVPEFYKFQFGIPDIATRLRYIAKLYNNELHIIAPTTIKSIFDLEGKRIEAQTDVGYYSAKVIFSRLNIHATFDFRSDDALAIQKLVDGRADAYITSTGKIFGLARNIRNEDRRLHLVPIPYDRRLRDLYLPTTLSGDEYPNLLSPGETIDTVATSVLLVSYNWPENTERYRRVARFVDGFFSNVEKFYVPPRHPKWKESSITINVPGWQRFKAAQDWLDKHAGSDGPGDAAQASTAFRQFLAEAGLSRRQKLSEAEMAKLYDQYLAWGRARK